MIRLLLIFLALFISQGLLAASSNEKVVLQGRIVDPTGTAVTNNNVNFDIKIYTPTTGVAGSHCLLYEETQTLDMSTSAGAFVLQIGTGTRVGGGPTLRETFTNATVASFGALTCGVGSAYTPGAIDDRSIEMTVSFGTEILSLAAIPVKAVPYAFQANQISGYGINNLVRLNGAGSATNLDVDQFNYLTGFFNDNGTQGNLADDFLNAQSLQIKNLAAPTLGTDAANKTYVDNAVAGVSGSLPALNSAKIWVGSAGNVAVAVSMSGDGTIDNTGKLTVTALQGKAVSATTPTSGQVLQYNGASWVPTTSNSLSSALTSAHIFVGNGSGIATDVPMSGDGTIDNTGKVTNTALQNVAVSATAPTSGQVLTYNGSTWIPTNPASGGTTISGGTQYVLPMFNAAGTNIVNSSVTDNGATGVDFANSIITFGGNSFANLGKGTHETYVGVNAGTHSGAGSTDNSGFGQSALSNNTGNYNTAVGSQALSNNTSAGFNTALGANALVNNNTGAGNTALGYGTISIGSSGSFNTAVGISAMQTNITGGYNVAVGAQALLDNNSGSNNIAVGSNSLTNLNSGNNNTALGNSAGIQANGASAGNVFIGNEAGPASAGAISNKLYIDSNSTNGNDTPLIGGDFSAKYVQINTQIEIPLTSATPTPTAGYGRVYAKADGNLYYKNATTEYQVNGGAVTLAGDVTGTSGANTVVKIQNTAVSATAPTSGQVLQYNGTNWAPTTNSYQSTTLNNGMMWMGNTSNIATAVTPSGDVGISSAGVTLVNKLQGTAVSATAPTSSQVLQYNGTNWAPSTLTPTLPALADTKIWVGNGSSVAMPVSASGDVTLADTGSFTVTKLQGRAIASTAPTANQVLTWNSTSTDWEPAAASGGTAISGGTQYVLPMFNAAGTNVINSSVTDNGATGVNFTNSMITFGGTQFLFNKGTDNTFLGASAGNTSFTAGTATDNTALGFQALTAVTTGANNTAVGSGAGWSVTAGAFNTFIGQDAGATVATGGSNVAIGSTAAMNGDFNNVVAVGAEALRANSGSDNVGIGQAALNSITTGIDNVAVGTQAGGGYSGGTTQSNTTSVGYYALYKNSGSNNTGIGWGALGMTLTGTNNTALGYSAGDSTHINAASTGNIFIGANSGPATTATYSNKLYIHNAQSDTPLIGGDFTNGYVQINNQIEIPLTSTTPTPTAGYGRVYAKADGNLYYKNATTEYQVNGGAVTLAGDVTGSSGANTVVQIQGKPVSSTAPTANQILQFNGSSWIPTTSTAQSSTLNDAKIWVGNSANLAAPVSMSGDATLADTGALTLNTVSVAKGGTGLTSYATGSVPVSNGAGALTATVCPLGQTLVSAGGTGFACGLQSASGSSLAAGDIWVGNASGIAVATAPAGDVTMTNAGSFTVAKLQGRAVASTAPTANQVLTWNSTNTDWEPTTSTGTTGSGTTNYVSKWTSASALGNSLIYDSGTAVGIGTTAPVSRLNVPWVSGDTATTATFGSTNASNNQIAIAANTTSNWAIKATANDSGSFGAIYGIENNGGVGVQGDSYAGIGVYGGSSTGMSGEFISDAAANSSPTLVVKQMGAGTADLFQIQNSGGTAMVAFKSTGNIGIGTTTPVAMINAHGGAIVSDTVSNLAAVTNIVFSTGNVQTSANSTNNAAFKICGMQDGGSYSLVLTAQPVGSIPTFTAYSDAACSVAITNFDAGGVTLQTTSATTIITFIRAGSTVYAMLATGFTH